MLRRLSWLFVLGAAPLFLVWNGDILTLYAVCGCCFCRSSPCPRPFLLIGGLLIVLPGVRPVWTETPLRTGRGSRDRTNA